MQKIDVSCFLGQWPFRKCREFSWEHLQKAHQKAGICRGYVSSVQSVFWNDPMEAEEELAASLAGTGYAQVCTANPRLPNVDAYIAEAVQRFSVRAVRICPGYHGYRLDDSCMEPLYKALLRHDLPLYITSRLEDPRMEYIVTSRVLEVEELRGAAQSLKNIRLLYTNLQTGELSALSDLVNENDNLYVETSGFRGPTNCLESVLEYTDSRKILFGSSYPLYALQSSLCAITYGAVSEETKEQILYKNTQRFFNLAKKER